MPESRRRILAPRPKHVRCVSDPYAAHGEGHNRVCVCLCVYCVAEREAGGVSVPPEQPTDDTAQLGLF